MISYVLDVTEFSPETKNPMITHGTTLGLAINEANILYGQHRE